MIVEFYPKAKSDITRQIRYYLNQQQAASTAVRFRSAVIYSIEQLSPHPGMVVNVRRSISGLRCWPVKGFEKILIYYLAKQETISIVRVLHGSRNVSQILQHEKVQ